MDHGLLIDGLAYLIIFFLATTVSWYIFYKSKLILIFCILINVSITVLLINIYFFIAYKFELPSHKFFNEFYEIFWLLPPLVTYIFCKLKYGDRIKQENRKINKFFRERFFEKK